MPLQDLDLIAFDGLYSLAPPTTDRRRRAADRFIVLFLSSQVDSRGSYFVDQVAGGQVKTNVDIGQVFAFTAAQILDQMRELAFDLVPTYISLLSFTFPTASLIRLNVLIQTVEGDIVGNIEVSTP